jgi:predicted permease
MLAGKPTEYFETLHFGPNSGGDLKSVFSNFNYTVLGRLRHGITQSQALAQLNVIQANLARTAPEKLSLYAQLSTVRDYAVASARQELWLLLAGVGAVLLIVCVNLGGLWTTRIADRQRDWAIRAALGAAPGRLVGQVLGESLALALIGGVLGICSAAAVLRAFIAAAPADIPRLGEVRVDWRVLVFGLLLSILAGLFTGLVPALRLSRADPHAYLKAGGAATSADRTSLRSRQVLIALQAALSTLLLSLVGLLGVSFYRLITLPTGFLAERAMAADIILNTYPDAQRDSILRQLPSAVRAIPSVSAAGFTSHLPLEGETWIDSAGVPGRIYNAAEQPSVNVRFVSPGYFAAIGIPLVEGRDLAESDRPAGWPPKNDAEEARMPSAVVISRATAELLWPGVPTRDLVGRKIVFNCQAMPTVVGVAADARDGSLTTAPPSVVYQPYWEQPPYSLSLVVRSALPVASLAAPLRGAIRQVASNAPIPALQPLSALKSSAVAPQRYQLSLLLSFAALALLLAAMGVYALVSHNVTRRRKELAIRMSMGARRGDLWALTLHQALKPVAGGVVMGVIVALGAGRFLSDLLFEISPANPAVLTAVAAVVLLAASAACLMPARSATRSDTIAALRAE